MANETQPIPAMIIVGFLGSGKTTLMSHLLDQAIEKGIRAGLVVNDFDEFNVDAHLLRRSAGNDNVLELPGGCMCCQLGDDLADALNTLLSLQRFDWFFIETSGLAEPLEVIHQLTAPALLPSISPALMVAIVDIEGPVPEQDGARLVWEQARCSQVVLLNKADQIAKASLERAAERIGQHAKGAEIIITEHAKVDMDRLLARAGSLDVGLGKEHAHDHIHVAYNSWARKLPGTIRKDAFETYLKEMPEKVVRAKGFIRFADAEGTFFFNRVGSYVQVAPLEEAGTPPAMMVCIGQQIDVAELEAEFTRRFGGN